MGRLHVATAAKGTGKVATRKVKDSFCKGSDGVYPGTSPRMKLKPALPACLRFAGRVTHVRRKTRFRPLVKHYRTGFPPAGLLRKVSDLHSTFHPPFPSLLGTIRHAGVVKNLICEGSICRQNSQSKSQQTPIEKATRRGRDSLCPIGTIVTGPPTAVTIRSTRRSQSPRSRQYA
jgi:hypothetical protein